MIYSMIAQKGKSGYKYSVHKVQPSAAPVPLISNPKA